MKRLGRTFSYLFLIAMIAGSGWVVWQREAVLDWLYLRGYQAPAPIAQLASDAGMTPLARHLFYVNHPQLEGKAPFNQHCPVDKAEQAVVLGCYRGDRQGIYLYDVTDGRLHGVEQVTAAHEMLHQAYDRLSQSERAHFNKLLENYASHQLVDDSIKAQLASYRQTEPDQMNNEMHSLFGTELTALPPELEHYYARYFAHRTTVVAYYTQYRGEFNKRQQQIAQYDRQLGDLKSQINAQEEDLTARQAELKQKRAQMDQALRDGQTEAYNAAVPGYNALVTTYNDELQSVRQFINRYNQLVVERNAIAVQETQLQQALDSHLTPVH